MTSRRSLIALLIALLHLAIMLAGPALSAAGQTNRRRAAQNKNRKPSPPAKNDSASDATPDTRGLKVQQINTGVTLEGRGKLWAVIVGVSRYKNLAPDAQLQYPNRDAEEFAAFLRSPQGGGFPSTQIKMLLNEQATLSGIRTALGTWLARSAEPDDLVYVFFAGHGTVEGERDGYLLAYDSDPQNLYATALSISELDKIISERLRARLVVLMADACHSGRIGMASRALEERVLVNRFLDEVGKSGQGVFRLLASRPDENSYEDKKWGGGHGVFSYYLLEGLKGKADRDRDGVVRAGELLDYLSESVPTATNALQHPRAAGNIETRLPLAVVAATRARREPPARGEVNIAIEEKSLALEVRGAPGSEVYIDNAFRGRIRPNGLLVIDSIAPGAHELSVDPPGGETLTQTVELVAARTVLDLKAALPADAAKKSSPLVAQIKEYLSRDQVLENGGAWDIYKKLVADSPTEPQRKNMEVILSSVLEEIGQQAINDYVRSPEKVSQLKKDVFPHAAKAFKCLMRLRPEDKIVESKQLFCEARGLIDSGKSQDAIPILQKAITFDAKAAYLHNALAVAYRQEKDLPKAMESFTRAATLAPNWSLPRFQIGTLYLLQNQYDKAAGEFTTAVALDPSDSISRLMLVRSRRGAQNYAQAEKDVQELLRVNANYAPAHQELGLIYEASRQYAKAADELEAYVRLAPNAPDSAAMRERARQNRLLSQGKKPK
jgi:uncharacterized caspase-like protein/tetratricopeptide (TPR) repeat protein